MSGSLSMDDFTHCWIAALINGDSALSPTPPFSPFTPYLRFSCVLALAFAASLVTSSHLFVKGTTLVTGFSFFGDPLIQRGMEYLDDKYPLWRKSLLLEKYEKPPSPLPPSNSIYSTATLTSPPTAPY